MHNGHSEWPKKVILGPLTFEFHLLDDEPPVVLYGVKVFLEGEEEPFLTQFMAPVDHSLTDIAKGMVQDMRLAARDPDELMRRVDTEIRDIEGEIQDAPIPPELRRHVRRNIQQMSAWAMERPDSMAKALSASPRMGDMWDFPSVEKTGTEERESPYGAAPRRAERQAKPAEERKSWAEPKGLFEFEGELERGQRGVDKLVRGWMKENPHNVVDILTGMFGLARKESLRSGIREALEAARAAGEGLPERKSATVIGRKVESFPPSDETFFAFKQALLGEIPELIKKFRGKRQDALADAWTLLGDQIYALES